jgi:excisionase family DNA binding protein
MPTTTPGPPDFFTIEEAARILRIGRTAAYQLARKWRATDGRDGLPVVAFGRLLRVPRTALEALGGGPLATACSVTTEKPKPKSAPGEPVAPPQPSPVARAARTHRRPANRSSTRSTSSNQTALPFT